MISSKFQVSGFKFGINVARETPQTMKTWRVPNPNLELETLNLKL
jgi:hypothetical protein